MVGRIPFFSGKKSNLILKLSTVLHGNNSSGRLFQISMTVTEKILSHITHTDAPLRSCMIYMLISSFYRDYDIVSEQRQYD